MTDGRPDAALAADLAAAAAGERPTEVRRFATGSHHYVFEAVFLRRAPLVVRIAADADPTSIVGAVELSGLLRPLGVPLPALLKAGLEPPHPFVVLERLAGTDLGHVAADLPSEQLTVVAEAVADAQRVVAGTPSAGRYGYGVRPEAAPHARWSDVLRANLDRSRRRIPAAGLFDDGPVDAVAALVEALAVELDAQPAVPFLHDTTTKNVIIAGDGAFSGIVDVDDLCFGDPRYAPALTLASLTNSGGPTAYVDAWMQRAGFTADRLFRLYVALFLVDFMSEHGQAFNGNGTASSEVERARLLAVFEAAVQRSRD